MADFGVKYFGGCCAALGLPEPEKLPLMCSGCRQVLHPAEPGDGEIDWLTTHQGSLDDIGREERQRQRAADIGPMDTMPCCEVVLRLYFARLQFRELPRVRDRPIPLHHRATQAQMRNGLCF
jgi:hypothetical protein